MAASGLAALNCAATPRLSLLRVLIVSDAAPARNGAGSYYQDLLPLLALHLAEVKLYSPVIDADGVWQAGFVLPLPGDSTQKLCFPDYRTLYQHFETMKPQLVIVATPGVYGISAAVMAKWRGIPFLTGFHTSFEQITELYWPDSWRGKLVERYFKFSNSYLIKRTAGVIGNSASILNQAAALGAANLHLVGTPIASDFLTHPVTPHSGTVKNCLYAGRLAKEKNLEDLLDTVANLPEMQFSIAGDGPLRPLVEQHLHKLPNLKYMGWLSRNQLREAVDSHDVLLLPSHFETFGTIALEAMSRQRIAIVTQGCGICEWPELAEGLIVRKDGSGFTQALTQLALFPPPQIQRLAHQALRSAHAFNSDLSAHWQALIQQTVHHQPAACNACINHAA